LYQGDFFRLGGGCIKPAAHVRRYDVILLPGDHQHLLSLEMGDREARIGRGDLRDHQRGRRQFRRAATHQHHRLHPRVRRTGDAADPRAHRIPNQDDAGFHFQIRLRLGQVDQLPDIYHGLPK
jgi:hypothetical protein